MSFMLLVNAGMSLYGAAIDDGTCKRILKKAFYLALSNNDKGVAFTIYQGAYGSSGVGFLGVDGNTIKNIANNAYVMTYNLTEAGQKKPERVQALGTIDDLFSLLDWLKGTAVGFSIHKAPDYEKFVEQLRILKKEDGDFNKKYLRRLESIGLRDKNNTLLSDVFAKDEQALDEDQPGLEGQPALVAPFMPKAPGGPKM